MCRLLKDVFFQNYHCPAFEVPSIRDLKNVDWLKDLVYAIKDDKKRALVNEVLAAFNHVVVPVMDKLPRGRHLVCRLACLS